LGVRGREKVSANLSQEHAAGDAEKKEVFGVARKGKGKGEKS